MVQRGHEFPRYKAEARDHQGCEEEEEDDIEDVHDFPNGLQAGECVWGVS